MLKKSHNNRVLKPITKSFIEVHLQLDGNEKKIEEEKKSGFENFDYFKFWSPEWPFLWTDIKDSGIVM